ncbi:PREDICTED: uncharacterized protein LOC106120398 [Papilio xuthus]|uniref:Uncharacterized protein LOC106120398 n=2 Tax=Papilio xuthus TaxID=66420 RepID=A0AAJ7EC10_PAPXU|nr:PREDICTED: uncharacterized protein LOC106120398 [Papilio xuthus]
MKNELVLSLFFYIGLPSGNTLPTSIAKLTTEYTVDRNSQTTDIDIMDTSILLSDDTTFTTIPKFDLEDHRNTINDSEILSQGVESPNNINGRSFIFIRQKFKSPMLNLFHSQMLNPNDVINASPKSALSNIDNDKFEELSRRFATLNVANPPKDKMAMDKMSKTLDKTQGTLLSQLCYSRLKLENDGMVNKIKDKLKVQDVEKAANEHREYLELLKPPLLRKAYNEDAPKLAMHEIDRQKIEPSNVSPYVRNQDTALTFAKISSNLRDSFLKKYNKDSRSYKPKGTYTKNKVTNHQHNNQHNLHDVTFHNVEENMARKGNEENTDEYKGIGKLSKNNFDKVKDNKMKPAHVNRIHYCHDCGKNVNSDPYHRKRIEADCKCGRHVYLKGRSEWEDQEQPGPITPTDKHQITVRYSPTDNKEEKAMIDVAIARNPHLY